MEVTETNEADYLNCGDSENFLNKPITSNSQKIFLKVSKLPSNLANEEQIKKHFKNYSLAENGVKMLMNKRGSFLDKAIVAFNNFKDCAKAILELDGKPFSSNSSNRY